MRRRRRQLFIRPLMTTTSRNKDLNASSASAKKLSTTPSLRRSRRCLHRLRSRPHGRSRVEEILAKVQGGVRMAPYSPATWACLCQTTQTQTGQLKHPQRVSERVLVLGVGLCWRRRAVSRHAGTRRNTIELGQGYGRVSAGGCKPTGCEPERHL